MATTIIPIGPRILVRPDDPIAYAGSIVIPETARKETSTGTVVAVGDRADDWETWPEVGDRVWFSKYGGHDRQVDGEELKLLAIKDVLAIVREDANEANALPWDGDAFEEAQALTGHVAERAAIAISVPA